MGSFKKSENKAVLLRKRVVDLSKACGRWGHVDVTSASQCYSRSWTKDLAMSPSSTVHGGQYDTTHASEVDSASGIRGGENFRRLAWPELAVVVLQQQVL